MSAQTEQSQQELLQRGSRRTNLCHTSKQAKNRNRTQSSSLSSLCVTLSSGPWAALGSPGAEAATGTPSGSQGSWDVQLPSGLAQAPEAERGTAGCWQRAGRSPNALERERLQLPKAWARLPGARRTGPAKGQVLRSKAWWPQSLSSLFRSAAAVKLETSVARGQKGTIYKTSG